MAVTQYGNDFCFFNDRFYQPRNFFVGQKPALSTAELVMTGWSHDEYVSPMKQIHRIQLQLNLSSYKFWVKNKKLIFPSKNIQPLIFLFINVQMFIDEESSF